MQESQTDLIECLNCHKKLIAAVWEIHTIRCAQNEIKKHQSIKREEKSSSELIPCSECGEMIEFSKYVIHGDECIGQDLKLCEFCGIKYPTYIFEEHLNYCEMKKQIENFAFEDDLKEDKAEKQKEYISSSDEDELYDENEEYDENFGMLISNLAESKIKQEGLTSKQIESLPRHKYRKNEECSICYALLREFQKPLELPCKHAFHKGCITPWLTNNPLCPYCKRHALNK